MATSSRSPRLIVSAEDRLQRGGGDILIRGRANKMAEPHIASWSIAIEDEAIATEGDPILLPRIARRRLPAGPNAIRTAFCDSENL